MQGKTLKILATVLCVAGVCILAYYLLPTLLSALAPFIIAYILSLAIEPLIHLLSDKLRWPRALAAAMCTLLALAILGGLLAWLGIAVWTQIIDLVERWPELYAAGKAYGEEKARSFFGLYDNLSPQMREYIDYGIAEARVGLTKLISPITNWLVYFARGLVAGVPTTIIFVIVTFLACNFMCAEKNKMRNVSTRIFGVGVVSRASAIWRDLKSALGGYVKAQLAIMCVSMTILLIGFSIAKIPFALLLALAVAVLDALPVFGSGAVLIPWSLISLLQGDYGTLSIMASMYIIIIVTRQILEPRILGKHIGVPPLLTLMSMYVGLKFIGIMGMLLGPVIVLTVKNLYLGGVFDRMLTKEKDENTEENIPEKEVRENE